MRDDYIRAADDEEYDFRVEKAINDALELVNERIPTNAAVKRLRGKGRPTEQYFVKIPEQGDSVDAKVGDGEESDDSDSDSDSDMDMDDSSEPQMTDDEMFQGKGVVGGVQLDDLPKYIKDLRQGLSGEGGALSVLIQGATKIDFNSLAEGWEAQLFRYGNKEILEKMNAYSQAVEKYSKDNGYDEELFKIKQEDFKALAHVAFLRNENLEKMKNEASKTIIKTVNKLRADFEVFIRQRQWPNDTINLVIGDEEYWERTYQQWKLKSKKDLEREAEQVRPGPQSATRSADREADGARAKPKKRTTRAGAVPQIGRRHDVDDDGTVGTDVTPGIVVEYEDKDRGVEERIVGFRQVGRGHQLCLQSDGNGKYKVYELVAARQFGDALDEYRRIGGTQVSIVDRKYMKDRPWSSIRIAGAAATRRERSKLFQRQPVTIVRFRSGSEELQWARLSDFETAYGKQLVKAKMTQYRLAAGQEEPVGRNVYPYYPPKNEYGRKGAEPVKRRNQSKASDDETGEDCEESETESEDDRSASGYLYPTHS